MCLFLVEEKLCNDVRDEDGCKTIKYDHDNSETGEKVADHASAASLRPDKVLL